jgi:hypothetical protein
MPPPPGTVKPKYLSTDHDPLFRFHRWLANLRVIEVEEIKSVPYAPVSHPLVERLIGMTRREYLARVFFWNAGPGTEAERIQDPLQRPPTAFTARSVARRPRNAAAHPQRRPPRSIVTLGGNIAAVCFRLQSPLN